MRIRVINLNWLIEDLRLRITDFWVGNLKIRG
jgi:hypothetical protein